MALSAMTPLRPSWQRMQDLGMFVGCFRSAAQPRGGREKNKKSLMQVSMPKMRIKYESSSGGVLILDFV